MFSFFYIKRPIDIAMMPEVKNFVGAGSKEWAEPAPLGWNRVN